VGTVFPDALGPTAGLYGLIAGPDGGLWFGAADGRIRRMSTTGTVSVPFRLPNKDGIGQRILSDALQGTPANEGVLPFRGALEG
jgi:streptogramin lyase